MISLRQIWIAVILASATVLAGCDGGYNNNEADNNQGSTQEDSDQGTTDTGSSETDDEGTTDSDQATIDVYPYAGSFSISQENFNPLSWNVDGVEAPITIIASDRDGQPASDGVEITFVTNSGQIKGSGADNRCVISGGACSVTWVSSDSRPADGVIKILAFTDGDESYEHDIVKDDGFDPGFNYTPLPEPFYDNNGNGVRDSGELYNDTNKSGGWNNIDAGQLYRGSRCTEQALENGHCASLTKVFATTSIIMGSETQSIGDFTDLNGATVTSIDVTDQDSVTISTSLLGLFGNIPAAGTPITLSCSQGVTASLSADTVPDQYSISGFNLDIIIQGTSENVNGSCTVTSGTASKSFEVIATAPNYVLGYDDGTGFLQGVINSASTNISADGETILELNVVNSNDASAPYQGAPIKISFTSACLASGDAELDPQSVTTVDDEVQTTYRNINCVGEDTISAQFGDSTASVTLTNVPRDVGRIGFKSISQSSIAYEGFAGPQQPSMTEISFALVDGFNRPVKGQEVLFTVKSNIPGEGQPTLTQLSATSDETGTVTTYLHAGTIGTSVRVIASHTTASGVVISNISLPIAVNTGPAHWLGVNIRADNFAPEVFRTADGASTVQQVAITFEASDRSNNPVADGTIISFWAEYGQIPASCEISSGACTVTWRSSGNLLVDSGPAQLAQDGRATILAWTAGEDSFQEGGTTAIRGLYDPATSILISAPERFYDREFNGTWNAGTDEYNDYDGSGDYTDTSTLYRGYACTEFALAADNCVTDVEVWDHLQLILATSDLDVTLLNTADINDPLTGPIRGNRTFYVAVGDGYGNQAPTGTQLSAEVEIGTVEISGPATVENGGRTSADIFAVTYEEDPVTNGVAPLKIIATSPVGIETIASVNAGNNELSIDLINGSTFNASTTPVTFDVELTLADGSAVPDGTTLELESNLATAVFSGGVTSAFVFSGNTTFTIEASSDSAPPTLNYVTLTAETPDGRTATAVVQITD